MEFHNKIPLYELLAMIIPGGVIIANILICIIDHFKIPIFNECADKISRMLWVDNAMLYANLIIAAYIVGILVNSFGDVIFGKFRNNQKSIISELRKVQEKNGSINLNKVLNEYKDLNSPIVTTYLKSYCRLAQNNLLGCIPQLESQVVMLRNLIIAFVVSLIIIFFQFIYTLKNTNNQMGINNDGSYSIYIHSWNIIMIMFIPICYFAMKNRQNKIYYSIWESINYYELK